MVPFPGADHAAEQGQKDADAARNGRNECARDNEEFHAKKDYAQNEQGRRLIAGQIPGNVLPKKNRANAAMATMPPMPNPGVLNSM